MSTTNAFFYGTLCHPRILQRVIGNDGSHLRICPAVLLDYTRHHVAGADYPAIIPYARTKELVKVELTPEDRSVRGTLVTGLTSNDIRLLDIFEGSEYTRDPVRVHPLGPASPPPLAASHATQDFVPATTNPLPKPDELAPAVQASAYVWSNPVTELKPELWSFEDFVRDNAWKWVGEGSAENSDYGKVDDARWEGRPTSA
ncbi:unnamed protein product [Peniophora sp. CBMAI 1063]|nr:unnamed protein product [Peniophora sp. CBMAI 1063]